MCYPWEEVLIGECDVTVKWVSDVLGERGCSHLECFEHLDFQHSQHGRSIHGKVFQEYLIFKSRLKPLKHFTRGPDSTSKIQKFLGPDPRPALNRGYFVQKSVGPGRALFRVPMENPVRHYML